MPKKILIVDDDVDTLRLVGMMLESEGFEIMAAKSGQRAIVIAHKENPDLIILDIMMPELDGYAVTSQLRRDQATRSIPILIFTAKTGMDDKMLGLELGADGYLTKPISTRELLKNVNSLLSPEISIPQPTSTKYERGTFAILAAKGGMAVSTTAINLGIALNNHTSQSVIVSDFRPGQGSLALELGHEQAIGFNRLLELPLDDINPQIIESELVDYNSGVRLLLSSHWPWDARYTANVNNFEMIARNLAELASYIVLDLGPGLTSLNEKVLPCCDSVFIITEPAPHSVAQVKTLIQELPQLNINHEQIKLIVFNRVPLNLQLSFGEVEEQLNLKIASAFSPNRDLAYQAAIENTPIVSLKPEGITAQQFNQLAVNAIQRYE